MYGCDILFLTLMQDHRLKVFENKEKEENISNEDGWSDGRGRENCIRRSFTNCTLQRELLEVSGKL
jgi:hypothetical protein